MDTNQVGSINFDANALYLEEDSEHEDDKQQDNELQALISQGGLDGFDDSLLSSSADSSYDDTDNELDSKVSKNQQSFQNEMNEVMLNQQQQPQPNQPVPSPRNSNHIAEPVPELNHPENGGDEQDESLFAHNLDQTAPPMNNQRDANFMLRNQYSTPAANHNAPPPQMLQATAIPTIKEDVYYQRQRGVDGTNGVNPNNINENESMPNIQPPTGMLANHYQPNGVAYNQQPQQQDQTIGMETTQVGVNPQNYANLQQQHYIPHSKLHSLDRFAVPSTIMPPPAMPQSHNHHEHFTDDHELSLNETDTEDDHQTAANTNSNNQYKQAEPQTPNFPMPAYGNNGVQDNAIADPKKLVNKNLAGLNSKQPQETSLIDLNELDEAQLKQLQAEEEQQQQEYFNIDHLNRLYCQAQFLYKIRGKKLEEVTNRFTAYQEDMSREIRAMKHRVYLAEKEKEGVQSSLDQAHALCTQYKSESDLAMKSSAEVQEKAEKLKQANRILEQKLVENEEEIENLQVQIGEQQKLDTLERVQEQHEHFIQQLRDKYEKDLMQMRESLSETQNVLKEKHEVVRLLTLQLETAGQNAERAAVERADTINRLTQSMNELQAKYDQDVLIAGYNNNKQKSNELLESERQIQLLQDKCNSLEDQVKQLKHNQTYANQTSDDFHLSRLSNTQVNADCTNNNDTMSMTLKGELERALGTLKQKRVEVQQFQAEIEQLKGELNATKQANMSLTKDNQMGNHTTGQESENAEELKRLGALCEELQREKIELTNDLIDKNTKLDEMMGIEEQLQSVKNDLELEIYSKQQHIHECEKMIEQLHAKNQEAMASMNQSHGNQQMINEFEAQIVELKLKVTNREHEVQKTREMYIEVCNEKNNLQDSMKDQFEKEYESKLASKIRLEVEARLDEQQKSLGADWEKERSGLVEEHRRQVEASLVEVKALKERLTESERVYGQLRVDKSEMEARLGRQELDLQNKCASLEKAIKESDQIHSEELAAKQRELEALQTNHQTQLEELTSKTSTIEATITSLTSELANEKETCRLKVEALIQEKSQLQSECTNLTDQFKQANTQLTDYQTKLAESNQTLQELNSQKSQELDTKVLQVSERLNTVTIELEETKKNLLNSEASCKDLMQKLDTAEKQLVTFRAEMSEAHKIELGELESRLKTTEASLIDKYSADLSTREAQLTKLSQIRDELQLKLDETVKAGNDLTQKWEAAKQSWAQEKSQLVAKKEEEFLVNMQKLEKRFEDDYSTFMKTHKDAIQKTLNEKSMEYAREKEKLIDMYERKLSETDASESSLKRKIKELDQRHLKLIEVQVQTSPVKTLDSSSSPSIELSMANQSQQDNGTQERINQLLEKIGSLEELIGNADAHFEQEIDRLRDEMDEDYQVKLKRELEREEGNKQHLIHIIEELKSQLRADCTSERNSLCGTEGHDVSDFNFMSTSSDQLGKLVAGGNRAKVAKLKEELELKEKEMETVNAAYCSKINDLQEDYNCNLKKMEQKYQSDIARIKQELNENYKQASAKAKNEIDRIQVVVQKLKKTNSDSDRVIESLKQEMNKMKEGHLNELAHLKMSSEREKEALKEKCDQYIQRAGSLDKKLAECDDRLKEHCDMLKANLKQEYTAELNKMQAKMKDMIKSHAQTVDTLKKQQQQQPKLALSMHQISKTCQTETSSKDIELLETFRQKYLETLAKMKSDMMKEFDAQTQRVSERVSRQINEERTVIQEKMHGVLMPKIVTILREYSVSEKLIEIRLDELERELIQITAVKNTSNSGNSRDTPKVGSGSLSSSSSMSSQRSNAHQQQYSGSSRAQTPLKYSTSNQTSKPSPRDKAAEVNNMPLYSKSVSSVRDFQTSTLSSTESGSEILKSTKSIDQDAKQASNNSNANNPFKSPTPTTQQQPLSNITSSGYKYTPLRQSWSNLTQMNQLTPYSPSSRCDASSSAKKMSEILQEESDRDSNYCMSPTIQKRVYISSRNSDSHQQDHKQSRPQTADSIYNKRTSIEQSNHHTKSKQIPEPNPTSLTSTDGLYSNYHQQETTKKPSYNFDFEPTEFDKNMDELTDELQTDFYQKYRTQNIRQKKSQHRSSHLTDANNSPRPHSASNIRTSTGTSSSHKLSGLLSSASNSNLVSTNNPIGALYEMSKNYKPIDAVIGKDTKVATTTASSCSAYSSTSSSSSRISSLNQNYDDNGHYKSNSGQISSASDYDLENETPIRLDQELSRKTKKMAGTSSSRTTAATRLSSTNTNNLTNVTNNGNPQPAFSHNSLPRSRSRSRSGTPNADLINQAVSATLSYRNGTVASSRKSIQQSNMDSLTSIVVSTDSPRTKSSYKPLSSQLAALNQKKKAFY